MSMNRQLAKHHAAARLRRENERQDRLYQTYDAIHAARREGREKGREEARAIDIPPDFMSDILDRMKDALAYDLAEIIGKELPGDVRCVLEEVARHFAKHMMQFSPDPRRNGGALITKMIEHHGRGITFRLSVPQMNLGYSAPHEEIDIYRGRRRT